MTAAESWGPETTERDIVASVPAVAYRAACNRGVWMFTTAQGRLLDRLGMSPNEVCSDPSRWVLMIHREDRERVVAARCRAGRSGHLDVEYRLQTPDGPACWVHDVAVRDEAHDDATMCGIIMDLTEHHRADDVLEELHDARWQAVTRLLRAAAVRDTTVQLFVHDMRSPLTAVAGLARTLRGRGAELHPSDRERVFGRMVAASDRVVTLVEDFARFWALPLDSDAVPVRTIDLAGLVADVIDEVDVAADGEDGEVEVDVGDVTVDTNPELLRRVLVGLLRNAIEHTPAGTRVTISAVVDDDRVILAVEDEGAGMSEDARERLFRPHGPSEEGGLGLGIGLTLVRAAVDLIGGDVCALEGANGGTVIRVELPRAVGSSADDGDET